MEINEMSYNDMLLDYKDTLRILIQDFEEAIEIRKGGEQNTMYFTYKEMDFLKEILEQKEAEVDGRC